MTPLKTIGVPPVAVMSFDKPFSSCKTHLRLSFPPVAPGVGSVRLEPGFFAMKKSTIGVALAVLSSIQMNKLKKTLLIVHPCGTLASAPSTHARALTFATTVSEFAAAVVFPLESITFFTEFTGWSRLKRAITTRILLAA